MTADKRYLWNRGKGDQQNWFLKLTIPNQLRRRPPFSPDGREKPHVVMPLDTGDLAVARRKRDEYTVAYRRVFEDLLAGKQMTLEQIKAATNIEAKFDPRTESAVRAFGGESLLRVIHEATIAAGYGPRLGELTALTNAPIAPSALPEGETISQAADAWYQAMQADPSAAVKQTTLDGHRLRVRAFIEHAGDIPLGDVTRATAADFLTKVAGGRSNRTTNAYATTLSGVFKSATHRGRFTGLNPFDGQKRKAGGESYEAFTVPELQTLFDSFKFETAPKHTPETALPWVSLIAAYSGMRLEEIAQLKAADIRDEGANGAAVTVIDIHNGGSNTLKNESSARLVPVHSALVRAGFLKYVKALRQDGLLFPGLTRRESKGGKIGARLGEVFRKRLEALGLKRERLCFHSFRHTVAEALEAAAVSQTDAARVLGHAIKGETYGTYSSGPGLKRLAAVVEEIAYPGLMLKRAALSRRDFPSITQMARGAK